MALALLNGRASRAVAGGVAIMALVAAAAWWVHGAGYARGYAAHEAETATATRALNARLKRAREALGAATAAFERERREARALQERLTDEARDDPDADRRAINRDGVRRIDSIR